MYYAGIYEALCRRPTVFLIKIMLDNQLIYLAFSLVHTVTVYAPVRPGSLQPADRGEPELIGTEFECVHIFSAVLRPRPGFGQKLITICLGNATVCDGA